MNMGGVDKWFLIDGDTTLRVEYPLGRDSLVIDLGAYVGDWSCKIHSRYGCRIEAYEPVSQFHEEASVRLTGLMGVHLHKAAVGVCAGVYPISVNHDGSSFAKAGETMESVEVIPVLDILNEPVDLIKMNIEGSEYDILEEVLRLGKESLLDNIQVQFHTFVPDFQKRYSSIAERLSDTHELTYRFPFVWENWKIKGKG